MQKTIIVPKEQEEWLRILGKGMVTIPKSWREELEIKEGNMIRAKKEGNRIIIETIPKDTPYRIYSSAELKQFLKRDVLPSGLKKKLAIKFRKNV